MIQLENRWTDLNSIWYGRYAIGVVDGQSPLYGTEPPERRGGLPGAIRCCALWGVSGAADPPLGANRRVGQVRWMGQIALGGAEPQTATARPIWNPLLDNSGIKQLPLLGPIVAQQWEFGSR
jgi:hypothetical protein